MNGEEARDGAAILNGDELQTTPGFGATLTVDGTSVLIQAESVSKFAGDLLVLDHGAVAVETSRGFKVRVNCLTVVPVAKEFTKYEVTDVNGTVQVAATKLDVNVQREGRTVKNATEKQNESEGSVHESEQKSYDESAVCGAPALRPGSPALNPKLYVPIGGAALAGLLCGLLCGGHGSGQQPLSNDKP